MSSAGTGLRRLRGGHRSAILDLVREHQGISIAIFGSVACGEATGRSDVDLLVEFDPSSPRLDVIHSEEALHGLLGVEVDVVSRERCSTVTKRSVAMP